MAPTVAPTTQPIQAFGHVDYTSTGMCYQSYRCTSNLASPGSENWKQDHYDWLTRANQKQDATVTFTLSAAYFVTSFDIWNQNEYSGGRSRDVKGITILYSNDGLAFQPATTAELANSQGAKPNPKNTVRLPAALNSAKYWQIKLTSFWTSDPHSGLMRVVINGRKDLAHVDYTATGMCSESSRCTSNLASPGSENYKQDHYDWLTPANQKQDATVTFTLSAQFFVTSFEIWNQNEYPGGRRDVKGITILYSNDGLTFQPATTAELANSQGAKPNPKNTVQLPPALPSAKYWQIKLTSFWTSDAYSGLMRVVINGRVDHQA